MSTFSVVLVTGKLYAASLLLLLLLRVGGKYRSTWKKSKDLIDNTENSSDVEKTKENISEMLKKVRKQCGKTKRRQLWTHCYSINRKLWPCRSFMMVICALHMAKT